MRQKWKKLDILSSKYSGDKRGENYMNLNYQ